MSLLTFNMPVFALKDVNLLCKSITRAFGKIHELFLCSHEPITGIYFKSCGSIIEKYNLKIRNEKSIGTHFHLIRMGQKFGVKTGIAMAQKFSECTVF